jgi:hypothetical protein
MHTKYWARDGQARTGSYRCLARDGWDNLQHRVIVPALLVDHAVIQEVLKAVTPVTIEPALAVLETAREEQSTIEWQRMRRREDAENAAAEARRGFLRVNAKNRRVRADLEARYETALATLEQIKEELATTIPSPVTFTASDEAELLQLVQHTRDLWSSDTTTNEDRKRFLSTVLSTVLVQEVSRDTILLELVWAGDLRQTISVLRPQGVNAVIRASAKAGMPTEAIVDKLNAASAVTARGRVITSNVVHQKLRHVGQRLKDERLLARQIIRQGLLNNSPRPQILHQLTEEVPRLGPWNPQRLSDEIRQLRKGVAGLESLPTMLPAEMEKNEILEIIDQGIAALENWKTIAARLNAAGLRPPRGTVFTPVQIRLLYMRARGLRSFRLPTRESGAS